MQRDRSVRGVTPASGRGRVWRLATIVAALLLLALASAAPASAQEPVFRVDALANSTAAPGSNLSYLVQVNNIGDTPTDGSEWDVVATLPAGMTGVDAGGGDFTCTAGDGVSPVAGATTIKCASLDVLTARDGVFSFQKLTITVAVDPSASGVLTSSFELSGGGATTPADTVDPVRIADSAPAFGSSAFDGQVAANPAGDPFTQAAGHPYGVSTSIDFNTITNPNPLIGDLWPVAPVKDVFVDLPPGFVGNPTAADTCTAAQLANSSFVDSKPLCPSTSQVGTTLVRINGTTNGISGFAVFGPVPVYNMDPPPGVPARFGFNAAGVVVTLDGSVRSGSDYGLSVDVRNISEGLAIASTSLTFWGVPSDPSHDRERGCPGVIAPWQGGPSCSSGAPRKAFLRNPTSCEPASGSPVTDGLVTDAHVDSWVNPGRVNADGSGDFSDPNWVGTSFVSHLPPAYPTASDGFGAHELPTGCAKVPFNPSLTGAPASPAKAGAPDGFTFDLTMPQSDDPDIIGQADLKKAVVTLPAGMRVSPSSADGLQGCSPAQVGLHSTADVSCPDGSKIGSLTIDTPLLGQPLTGAIYLASPHDNPFGTLLGIYLVAKGPGLIVKLPGRVDADPSTGQLTATFDDNPQLPFSKLHLEFDGGPRSPLVLPPACGTYAIHSVLTAWSGKTVTLDSPFTLDSRTQGGSCPSGGQFSPGFAAGVANPVAGADSSFALQLTRGDQDQELSGLTVDMPTGLLGHIANTVLCPDGAANAGSCTGVSQIGGVTVGAGAGSNPFYITSGRAYITGPYKGAPYGLSIVVPAVAGPFDLGNVVVRAAIFVDKATAALKVVSDPLPTILQGIPLQVRDVRVSVDRPHFIVNPTSCAVKQVLGTIASTQGAIAHVGSRFQVGECASLPLAPKLSLTVGARKHTRAGVSTPVTATLTQTAGQTNLRSVSVALPGTLNALLPVVNRACDRSAFNAGHCTNATRVGSAVAVTPLLRDPLRGSAYFVKTSPGHLPDLMVTLRGLISIDLTGKVSIPGGKRLATTFATIPDAPITKFTLRIVSGKNGPVGIATNLCSAKGRSTPATLAFRGQNGKLVQVSQRVKVAGCPKAAKARKAKR